MGLLPGTQLIACVHMPIQPVTVISAKAERTSLKQVPFLPLKWMPAVLCHATLRHPLHVLHHLRDSVGFHHLPLTTCGISLNAFERSLLH